jgi:dTDP-4-amino-4,6-dideoxygalactose transaminase
VSRVSAVDRPVPLLSTTLDLRALEIARAACTNPEAQAGDGLVRAWERRFSTWLGRGHARGLGSGRAALRAVAHALDLRPGDEVIVPAFTCQSVINAFRYAGAEPRHADIEVSGFGLDVDAVRTAITRSTRAIMVQHTFGLVGRDFDAVRALAADKGLLVIEDCAHALGATWRGEKVGTFGDAAIFSFERGKMLTTVHGGMAVVHGEAARERLETWVQRTRRPAPEQIRSQMASVQHDYWMNVAGNPQMAASALRETGTEAMPRMWPEEFSGASCPQYEERMVDAVAALADSQFDRLDEVLRRRRAQAVVWQDWADRAGLPTAREFAGSMAAWLRFPVWVDPQVKEDPSALQAALGVDIGVWFTSPCHPVPSVQPQCPRGMEACRRVVNLPTLLPEGHPLAPR